MTTDQSLPFLLVGIFIAAGFSRFYSSLNIFEKTVMIVFVGGVILVAALLYWDRFSKPAKERQRVVKTITEMPEELRNPAPTSIFMGDEVDLKIPIHFPDHIRLRHVDIVGSTGTAKTEGVQLNFIRQDVQRGLGTIILDAKGDASFLQALDKWVPKDRLKVFDLGSEESLTYDPLEIGSPLESAQRLFSSMTWSEEYYKSKALSTLQTLFQYHFGNHQRNPTLADLNSYLEDQDLFMGATLSKSYTPKMAQRDFDEVSGLRDQIRTLCIGHLRQILSPAGQSQMRLKDAGKGDVLYFRLQSLLSPQIVSVLGKLLINHMRYLAGQSHRNDEKGKQKPMIPVYLDEFASFACPEFTDLISKGRSAGYALHFAHQSLGDLYEVSEVFATRVTDNSSTLIILRINDPNTADYFARAFGTKVYQKVTHRVSKAHELDSAEISGEGTQREAHQFRAPPDLLKTLPTGTAAVRISHGGDAPDGAVTVLKVKFPFLKEEKSV